MPNNKQHRVSVIIPAFNEAETITNVVTVCRSSEYIQDIVVVDDGSTDQTSEKASIAGAKVCILPENLGKAAALFIGVKQIKTKAILLLDADLIGLETRHVDALVKPVLATESDATLGLFTKGRFRTDLAHRLTPFLSGQRCLNTAFFLSLEEHADVRYGIEIVITKALQKNHLKTLRVPLDGVTHRMKEEKRGHESGWWKRMEMYRDIVRELFR